MLNSSTDRIYVNVSASVMITSVLHLVGNEKKKEKKSDHGHIAFSEHGVESGMAMIKYPLYKKNNSRKNTLLYPGRQIV